MNPPYSHPAPWVDRFITHRHGVALLTVAKSAWSQRLWDRSTPSCSLDGRPPSSCV